ncbi:MAG: lipid A biosynthesis lauroyl acyltransferase [Alphaproteobacteria bacterium]|nr:lipid A biosynthesis lauroyl acyltransferase [Alphaproteobacteria bacterium]
MEAALVRAAFAAFALLPIDTASAIGGAIALAIGPHLPVSRTARRNLKAAFPALDDASIEAIVAAMWNNLGRTAAEYPHLGAFDCYEPGGRVEVVGAEVIDRLRDDGAPGIFFGIHQANWEIMALAATQRGVPLDQVYRAANNPYVEIVFQRIRHDALRGRHHKKGTVAARALIKTIKEGGHLAMLVDQKQNDGIAIPFFGRPAMTAPAIARLALKYDCPVIAARIERLGGARFRMTILPPLAFTRSGDTNADIVAAMTTINALIETWIRERPAEWLWLHRRWPN